MRAAVLAYRPPVPLPGRLPGFRYRHPPRRTDPAYRSYPRTGKTPGSPGTARRGVSTLTARAPPGHAHGRDRRSVLPPPGPEPDHRYRPHRPSPVTARPSSVPRRASVPYSCVRRPGVLGRIVERAASQCPAPVDRTGTSQGVRARLVRGCCVAERKRKGAAGGFRLPAAGRFGGPGRRRGKGAGAGRAGRRVRSAGAVAGGARSRFTVPVRAGRGPAARRYGGESTLGTVLIFCMSEGAPTASERQQRQHPCAGGGIGRRAGFRFQCPKGRGGSTPPSRTHLGDTGGVHEVRNDLGRSEGSGRGLFCASGHLAVPVCCTSVAPVVPVAPVREHTGAGSGHPRERAGSSKAPVPWGGRGRGLRGSAGRRQFAVGWRRVVVR